MWLRYLTDPLQGKSPLWQVIWVYGFAVSLAYLLIEPLFLASNLIHGVYYALGIVITVAQSVMLWRCSYNARSPTYGRLLRVLVVAGVVMLLLLVYLLWRDPGLRGLLSESGLP